jgi:hypothetical protein
MEFGPRTVEEFSEEQRLEKLRKRQLLWGDFFDDQALGIRLNTDPDLRDADEDDLIAWLKKRKKRRLKAGIKLSRAEEQAEIKALLAKRLATKIDKKAEKTEETEPTVAEAEDLELLIRLKDKLETPETLQHQLENEDPTGKTDLELEVQRLYLEALEEVTRTVESADQLEEAFLETDGSVPLSTIGEVVARAGDMDPTIKELAGQDEEVQLPKVMVSVAEDNTEKKETRKNRSIVGPIMGALLLGKPNSKKDTPKKAASPNKNQQVAKSTQPSLTSEKPSLVKNSVQPELKPQNPEVAEALSLSGNETSSEKDFSLTKVFEEEVVLDLRGPGGEVTQNIKSEVFYLREEPVQEAEAITDEVNTNQATKPGGRPDALDSGALKSSGENPESAPTNLNQKMKPENIKTEMGLKPKLEKRRPLPVVESGPKTEGLSLKALSSSELLGLASSIKFEGRPLKELFKSGEISRSGLEKVVQAHLSKQGLLEALKLNTKKKPSLPEQANKVKNKRPSQPKPRPNPKLKSLTEKSLVGVKNQAGKVGSKLKTLQQIHSGQYKKPGSEVSLDYRIITLVGVATAITAAVLLWLIF